MQPTIQIICNIPQRSVTLVPNQDSAQRGTIPFHDYGQFMDLCDHSSVEDKPKLVEFYLHNMSLIDMNLWDPNVVLRDLKLMAMASWMSHEEKRAT